MGISRHLEAHHHFQKIWLLSTGEKLNIFSFDCSCWSAAGTSSRFVNIPMKYWSMCHISVNAVGIGEEDAADLDYRGHCAVTQFLSPWHLRMTCRPSAHGSEHLISPSVVRANTQCTYKFSLHLLFILWIQYREYIKAWQMFDMF